MANLFFCVLQLFLHSRGKHQVDHYDEDFGGQLCFPMDIFAFNCFTFLQLVDYIIMTNLTLSSSGN